MVEAVKDVGRFDRNLVRETAIKNFGKNQMVDNYIRVYEDILSKKD